MKVCIAEKPSVAKEIAEILGAKQRKEGYFEGNGYQVTWTFGHFCELKEPHEYDSAFKEWNLNMLPILPDRFGIKLKKDQGVEKQFNIVSKLFEDAEEIINCGDAGQEGELIQRWVIAKAQCKKPVKRLWISSLTEESIREGFKNLKESSDYERLYFAGYSRACADWLLGLNATRLYTIKYGGKNQLLSIGRVQTPTLAMIVNRQLEIQNFKSQTTWELKTKYRNVFFTATKGRFTEKEKANNVLEEIKDSLFEIISFETKKGKESSPRLFDLTGLQVECNKKFGFSADDTLKGIQDLYEKKLVTYPRVDTTYLPNDIYPKIKGILQNLKGYNPFTSFLLKGAIRKSTKVFDDKKVTDHHAIIPTGEYANGLSERESKVYDTITKRFLAAFYPDCEVANTTVLGKAKDTEFRVTGKQILSEGWREVYNKDSSSEETDEESQSLPIFKKGESGPHEPVVQEKQSQPPKPHTEASLLRAMETAGRQMEDEELRDLMKQNGIGRPSTRAAIIETLFRRNYIKREKKNIVATVTGVELIRTIKNELLKSAELTGKWEFKLRQIEKGEYEANQFLQEMKEMVAALVTEVKSDTGRTIRTESPGNKDSEETEDIACPKCKKGKILKGRSAMGCSEYKSGCEFKVPFELMGKTLNASQLSALIKKGKTPVLKGFLLGESKKNGILKLNPDFNIEFEETEEKEKKPKSEKKPAQSVCPKCKKGNVMKGNSAYGCSDWKIGCSFRLPFNCFGVELTEAQINSLLKKGETPVIKNLLVDGKKLNKKIILDEEFKLCLKQ